MMSRSFLCVALLLLASGCAAPKLGDESDTGDIDDASLRGLIGGSDASPTDFPSTVSLEGCTGAKVAPNKILTAAHCVMNSRLEFTGGGLARRQLPVTSAPKPYNIDGSPVKSDGDPRKGFVWVKPKGAYIDPAWVKSGGAPDYDAALRSTVDLAVIVVDDQDVPLIGAIPTASVDTVHLEVGNPVTIMGYGCEDESEKKPYSSHLKFIQTNVVKNDDGMEKLYFATPSGLCPGDSGGPVYGPKGIVGVNSGGGRTNIHTRLSNTWIAKALADSKEPGLFYDMDAFGTTCLGGGGTVVGAIDEKYRALGGCSGLLGAPKSGEKKTPDGLGRFVLFESGSIYWTPDLKAHEVHGRIRDAWEISGWERGPLGYPISDQTKATGDGSFNEFEQGAIYDSSRTGAHLVVGKIYEKWRELGLEQSTLGYPITDEYGVTEGRRSDFERGSITWDTTKSQAVVTSR